MTTEPTNNSAERLDRWIDAISKDWRVDLKGVLMHLQKHCGQELIDDYNNDRLTEWLASLENLTQIIYKLHGFPSNEIRLQRLQEQVAKYPNDRTPEPTTSTQADILITQADPFN